MICLLRSGFAIELFINGVLPWLVYTLAQPGVGRVHALMASAIPPIAWSAIQFVQSRRIDAISIFVLTGIGLSLLAFFGGGSFRLLELREHLVTGVIGLVFLGSVAIKRPMLIVLARTVIKRSSPEEAAKFESRFDSRRGLMTYATLGFGFLLLIQTAVAISLVLTLPVREFLIVSPILSYVMIGLFAGGVLYMKRKVRTASAEAEHGQRESNS